MTDLATEATKEEEMAQKSASEDDSEQFYQKPKFQPVVFRPTNSQFQKPQNNRQSYKENVLNERKESIDEGAEQEREGYLEINPDGYGFCALRTVNSTRWTLMCPQ